MLVEVKTVNVNLKLCDLAVLLEKNPIHIFFVFTEQGKVRNLRVSEETTDSFRVSWMAAPGAVVRYRLTYVPIRGDHPMQETTTAGPETTIVLQQLLPITTYRVSVSAEYGSGLGPAMQIDGTTKEGESHSKATTWQVIHIKCGVFSPRNNFIPCIGLSFKNRGGRGKKKWKKIPSVHSLCYYTAEGREH